jgi:hypothetical protein
MIHISCFYTDAMAIYDQVNVKFTLLNDEKDAMACDGPLLLGLNKTNLDFVKKVLSMRSKQVIISIKNKQDFLAVPELKSLYSKIFGFIDLSAELDIAVPLIKNYSNIFSSKEVLDQEQLSKKLTKIEENTRTELRGIKELHDRFVKMRKEKIKGLELLIKFMAGEKSGGEFFDYLVQDSHILFVQAGSDSYIMSSLIISALEDLKVKNNDFNLTIDSFISLLNHHAIEHQSKLSFTIMILNLKNLEASIYSQGNSKLFFNNEIISVGKSSILKLNRGSKVTFLSEGTLKNWNNHNDEKKLLEFLLSYPELSNRDFINEIFFELARHKEGMFLTNDALVVMFEIDQNVLLQL